MEDNTGHSFSAYYKRAVSPLIVLSLLKEKPMYGYEISQEMGARSNQKLTVAVLYPILYRLEQQGFICDSDTIVENGRARSYYSITPAGEEYLAKVSAEYHELSDILLSILDSEV